MTILPKTVREEKLRSLRADESKAIGKQKLFYKDEPRIYPTFEVNLDLLIYNEHNGRLESDMLTWKNEHSVENGVYNEELHDQIEKFLWDVNIQRNKQTLEDLQEKGQLRPAIVTLDGVIIDGNRRAMLLRRAKKQFIEAVILPDAYAENEREIVKLETQYQMGEDAKLDYGPLEKYLHVKRLKGLDIKEDEIADLMGISTGEVEKLKGIMELMDEYLDQIDCTGLYTMLRQSDGTKEGMFVDLYQDLKRFKGGSSNISWPVSPTDLDDLKTIQFDYIRFGGEFSDTGKTYRAISHDGAGKKSFFAHLDIWKPFSDDHHKEIDPISEDLHSLDTYVRDHPECETRVDAAEARDREWKDKVKPALKRIFGKREDDLTTRVEIIEPGRLLSLALNALEKIDLGSDAFTSDPTNADIVNRINNLTFEMRKRFSKKRA